MDDRRSILSHGERDVAGYLRENPERSAEEIAEQRGVDPAAVERSIERVREKTERAIVTLAQSPFVAEVAADLDPEVVRTARAALDDLTDDVGTGERYGADDDEQ